MSRSPKGWYSRGYLPHLDVPGLLQSVTFRLHDAVPTAVIEQWQEELRLTGVERATDPRTIELRDRIEVYSDRGNGACWLREPAIAALVESALLHFDGERYRLLAWCVMPNHVHALVETLPNEPLHRVVQSWKSFTALEANRALRRTGRFWMPDFFDRFIRDDAHLRASITYIEGNPVKACLCSRPEDWPWSSASLRAAARPAPPSNSLTG